MDSLIRWKRSDYMKLSHAVRRFNNIINEIENVEYIPDLQNYKDIRDHITTRRELNRVLNALHRANTKNLTAFHTLESGEDISKWEFQEITKARKRAYKNLEKERISILTERESIGMGEERISEIKAIERSFKNLEVKTGADLKRLKERILSVGRTDYKLAKDKLFQENFYTALEGISNFQNYDVLKRELDKIKNPTKFYEYVKKSPVLMDLFLWYKESDSLFYGSFNNNQEAFNSSLLYHLGIEDIE